MDNPIFSYFITLTIFSLMLSVSLNHSFQNLKSFWHNPKMMLKSLFAVIVLVPLWTGILLWLFDLPAFVATGLAVLAAVPGAPLTYKRAEIASADPNYMASLQLSLVLVAIITVPIVLVVFSALFSTITLRATPIEVAYQVGKISFLPIILGWLIQYFSPNLASRIRKPINWISNILFICLMFLILVLIVFNSELREMLAIGWIPSIVIIIMAAGEIAIGHFMSGESQEKRSALATACVARNVGLAIYLADLSDFGQNFVPTLLAYMLLGAIVALPYAFWSRKQIQLRKTS